MKHNAKGSACVRYGLPDKYFAFVVLFDNAFGQRESESPPSRFGSVSGLENLLDVFALDALACVGYVDQDFVVGVLYGECDFAFVLHCIDGVLAQVFDYPFHQCLIEFDPDLRHRVVWCDGLSVPFDGVADLFGSASAHIVDGVGEDFHQVGGCQYGRRANFGESFGNGLEPLDVFIHFHDQSIVGVIEFEQLTAGVQG